MSSIPKILLLQAREAGDPMLQHELDCFITQTGVPAEAFVPLNVAVDDFDHSCLHGFDAMMVGGSGDFSFTKGGFAWAIPFQALLREAIERRLPTFGSCFGYQGIVTALGGRLERMEGVGEIGTYAITLTAAGQRDPMFEGFPTTFMAQLGHNDRSIDLPAGCIHLASSTLAPYQAIRVEGTPVFATQFHPELDRTTNFERFLRYIENYKLPGETIEEAKERSAQDYKESPEASRLLRRFLQLELDYEPA